MNDRELLELAAKAAGLNLSYYEYLGHWGLIDDDPESGWWNPLTDDGDALRLAVRIGIRNYFGIEIQDTCAQATAFEPWEHCEYEEFKTQHPFAAARRAIVRAAAEIGKKIE